VSGDFTVHLERIFEGPMDLLLHLVKEQEVEIHEVRIADVVSRYLEYVKHLEGLDIEIAGEFLVLAATLMAIKSRSLLPREEVELGDDLDPEDELIQRLIEYRRFKGAADDLEDRWARRLREHRRGFQGEVAQNAPERTLDLGELTAFDLLAAFSRLMRETLAHRPHHVKGDPRPLRWYVREVGRALHEHREVRLGDLIDLAVGPVTRESVIGVFCALLELMKLGIVSAHQESQQDEIQVKLQSDAEDLEDLIGASRFMDEEDVEDGLEDDPGPDAAIPETGPDSAPEPGDETR
jgi:segregation and condensation protein A